MLSSPVAGLISDTHGLLRAEAVEALRGCEVIVHAGDVGDPEILERLGAVAPVRAVRGNMDRGGWAADLASTEVVEVGGRRLYVIHDLGTLDLDPAAAGFDAVVYGHTHRPASEIRGGVLFVNPGAAGHRRFDLPVTVARLRSAPDGLEVEHVRLASDGSGEDVG